MQRTPTGEVVIVPRNFKLLQELEKSEKGLGEMGLSMGLVDPSDTFLSHWNAGILVSSSRNSVHVVVVYEISKLIHNIYIFFNFTFSDAHFNHELRDK